MARNGEESRDLDFAAVFFLIRERKRRWEDGSAPTFRDSDPRGGDGVHDARVFLGGADAGPRPGNRVLSAFSGTPRFACGLCRGSGRHRTDALGSVASGSDCRSADTGLSYRNLVSDHGGALSAALRRGRSQHRRSHVFPGIGRPGSHSVDGRRDLPSTGSLRAGLLLPLGSDGDSVSNPSCAIGSEW